ncbi:hypothetical protein MKX03_007258, partial [Papaver bracteatum]
MKTSLNLQEDADGWRTIKSKKVVRSGNSRSLLNKNGLCCWIEAKGFSFTKGYGIKSGKIQIIETKGDRFSTLWINQKGLSWFLKGLLSEISKPWLKSQVWQFSDLDEWLTVTRGRNNNGEYMKLSGPNSWGNTVDIYFPAGNLGEGWKQVTSTINHLCPIQGVSQIKHQPPPAPNSAPNPRSVWSKLPQEESGSIPIEKENWNLMVVLSADVEIVQWELVGKHLGMSLEKDEEFFLQPFSNSKAMFKVQNTEMRKELFSKAVWEFNGITFSFLPWTSQLNLLSEEDITKVQSCWIMVNGVPFSLWNLKTFETIGAKCGGLLEVSEDTKNGYNLSVIKLKVRGPVDSLPKVVEVNFKSLPFRALIERAEDQSSLICNDLRRIKVCNQDSVIGDRAEGVPRVFHNESGHSTDSREKTVVDKGKSKSHVFSDKANIQAKPTQSRGSSDSNNSNFYFRHQTRPLEENEVIIEGKIRDTKLCNIELGSSSIPLGQAEWTKAKWHGKFPSGFFSSAMTAKKSMDISSSSDSPSCSVKSDFGSYPCGDSGFGPDEYTSDSSYAERGRFDARLNLEAARDSIGECIDNPCTSNCRGGRADSIANSGSQPKLMISIPTSSASSKSNSGNSKPNPPFSPTGEFFMQALSDPEKEAM